MTNAELKALRLRLGYSQYDFSIALINHEAVRKASLGTISRWERALPILVKLPAWVEAAAYQLEKSHYKNRGQKIPPKPPQIGDKRWIRGKCFTYYGPEHGWFDMLPIGAEDPTKKSTQGG